MTIRRTLHRLLAFAHKRQIDRELEQEIAAHLELAQHEGERRGLSPEEARRVARLRFGGVQQVMEEHRERRGLPRMESLLRDLSYGWASLRSAPGFSAILIGVLALGIGANVAMFSVLDAVLLRPLPFAAPERIAGVWEAPQPGSMNATTVPEFLEWRRLGTVFDGLSAEQSVSAALTGVGDPVRLPGKLVTADYFRVFPAPAQLGRTFAADDLRPGAAPVIVISYAAWQNQFGGDPEILRRRIVLDGGGHQIIGVLAPGAFDRDTTRFWKPLIFNSEQLSSPAHWLRVYGRLRSDTNLARAREQMQAIHAALTEHASEEARQATIAVEALSRVLVGPDLERSMYVAFGAVALVLLIACANVANLLLARGVSRRRELAVRAAIGASPARLIQQLLTESFLACLAGGLAGIAVAGLLIRIARPLLADSIPFTAAVTIDLRVLLFAGAVVSLTTLLAGALPAIRISLGHLAPALNQSGRGASGAHAGVRRAIVAAEVALSLVLLSGALLLFRSLLKLQNVATGIRIENVTSMSLDLPLGTYRTPQQGALFYQSLSERLRRTPGVMGAGFATALPLEWIGNGELLEVAGNTKTLHVRLKRVDPGYFATMGIPVRSGRGIGARDRAGAPGAVVINEALAGQLAEITGLRNSVGQVVGVTHPGYEGEAAPLLRAEIVGVIRDERVAPPGFRTPPVVYLPLAQAPSMGVNLLVRSQTATASVMPAIRESIRQIDPSLPIGDVATMEQVRARTLTDTSRPAWLIGAFALIAAVLTGIGLYGVVSYSVTQRRKEIGIRMALGARGASVVAQVLRNALAVVAAGLALGMPCTFALTRVMKSMLYEVSPLDGLALTVACASMVAIGAVAALIPAARAAGVDAISALRNDG